MNITKMTGIAAIALGVAGCQNETQYLNAKTTDGFDVVITRLANKETGALATTTQEMHIGTRKEGFYIIDGTKSYIHVRDELGSKGGHGHGEPLTITIRKRGQSDDTALVKYATPRMIDSLYHAMTNQK